MNEDLLNKQFQKLVVHQQCKNIIDKFETGLERKKLFNKNYKH